jgi:hypothetical protein
MTTKITEQNVSNLANAGVQWQSVFVGDGSTGLTTAAGKGYFIDTTGGAVTVTLPSSPNIGDTLSIVDYGGNSATNNIILSGNGSKILSSSLNKTISTNEVGIVLVFTDSTKGWVINGAYVQTGLVGVPGAPTIGTAVLNGLNVDVPFTAPTDNGDDTITSYTATANPGGVTGTLSQAGSGTITVTGLATNTAFTFTVTATNSIGTSAASAASNSVTTPNPDYVAATGGTIATVGDFKIHSFTGDGCFVVSPGGNAFGSNQVDYLVVGGGGGANDTGGGGAGGFRESHSTPVSGCYTASPLATPTAITVSTTTYPITVGAGGGNDSTFSTITSAGGGGGAHGCSGGPGGSGGGAGYGSGTGGAGNTPPVSPPQGQPGGDAPAPQVNPFRGAGGGGAGQAGSNQPGGNGGNGVTTTITNTPTTYAGGGGGAGTVGSGGNGGTGGGGASGSHPSQDQVNGENGTANRGGGGGSASGLAAPQGTRGSAGGGGSGIVVIRYKFQ